MVSLEVEVPVSSRVSLQFRHAWRKALQTGSGRVGRGEETRTENSYSDPGPMLDCCDRALFMMNWLSSSPY